jgi:glycosyltransferase involved in cell wall biosynthesis
LPPTSPAPLLLSVFPTFAMGGAQMRFTTIANQLGDRFRHAIIAMNGEHAAAARLAASLSVSRPEVGIRKGDMAGNVRRFTRLLRQVRPHALVTHNWGSIEWAPAARLAGIRHIHIEDGFGPEEGQRQLRRRVWTRRLLLRRATVVVPSRTLHAIATGIWKLPQVRYIPNGIDLAAFAAAPARGEIPVIGTVAALRPEKNLARLLHAFQRAAASRPARLVIAGDGPARAGLEALAGELGIADRVRFTGYVARPQTLYPGFDIVALSSDTEQMPMAVLEAMAAGLPVAATDVGDIRAMVAAENAPYLTRLDPAALGDALGALLDDPALRARLGAANRARAEQEYDQAAMVAAYEALYRGPLA